MGLDDFFKREKQELKNMYPETRKMVYDEIKSKDKFEVDFDWRKYDVKDVVIRILEEDYHIK